MRMPSLAAVIVLACGPVMAQPSWTGTYRFEHNLGRDVAGETTLFVTYTLKVTPSSCRFVGEGFQRYDQIRCRATPRGNRLEVSFLSFADGGMKNSYGNRPYKAGQPLFSLVRGPDGLVTRWQAYEVYEKPAPPAHAFVRVKD